MINTKNLSEKVENTITSNLKNQKDNIKETMNTLENTYDLGKNKLTKAVEENPMTSLLVAGGVGIIIAIALLSKSKLISHSK